MEGFSSILAALVGTLHGTTSYSQMIGFITYTGVTISFSILMIPQTFRMIQAFIQV